MALTREDFTIGAIERLAVRRGIGRAAVEELLNSRAGLSRMRARQLAGHWFDTQYRHGGIAFWRQKYLAGLAAPTAKAA
jgi:hypothetical protein